MAMAMTPERQAQLKAITADTAIGWWKHHGVGYRIAAKHFAGENATDRELKYIEGRFRRYLANASKAKKAKADPSPSTEPGGDAPTAPPTPQPVAVKVDSLAELATEGDFEEFLLAKLRQVEDAAARMASTNRSANAGPLATLARLGMQIRTDLKTLRADRTGDIAALPPHERAMRLAMSAPAWPDEAVRAGAWEWFERGCP